MKNSQNWLNETYSFDKKTWEKEINNFSDQELEGEIVIENFPELERINLSNSKGITKLTVKNCPQVKRVDVYDNQITELNINELEELEYLHCGNNQLKELTIAKNIKIRKLFLDGNSQLESIEGLENLTELISVQPASILKNFFEKKVKELENDLTIEKTFCQQVQREKKKLEQKLQSQRQSLQELEQQKISLEDQLNQAQSEASVLRGKVSGLQTELKEAHESHQQTAVKLDKEKAKLLDTNLTEEELQEVKNNVERLENELIKVEKNLEKKLEEILELRKKLLDKERKIKQIELEEKLEKETEIKKVELELEDLRTRLQEKEGDLADKKEKLSNTKQEIRKNIKKTFESNKLLYGREEELIGKIKSLEKEIVGLQGRVNSKIDEELNILQSEKKRLQKQIKKAQNVQEDKIKLKNVQEKIELLEKLKLPELQAQTFIVQKTN